MTQKPTRNERTDTLFPYTTLFRYIIHAIQKPFATIKKRKQKDTCDLGATAKFSANGKVTKKKDLAAIAMSYGTVYVAQIAMGADYNQTVKAICEAESYPGTSIIIAYAPCISHGIRAGLGSAQHEEEKAVKCGYWNMLRYDPRRTERGENPLMIDSKEPTESFKDFLSGEIRYDVVTRNDSQRSKHLLWNEEMGQYQSQTKIPDCS